MPLVYVHLGHGLDAQHHAQRFRVGLEVDDSPYGFAQARSLGLSIRHSTDAEERPLQRWGRRVLKRLLGFDLIHAWRNRHQWQSADVIWTVQESEWLAIVALGCLGVRRPPVVANSVWLFDQWPQLGPLRRGLYRQLAARAEQLTVHASAARAAARRALPGVPVRLLRFGVASQRFDPPPPPQAGPQWPARPLRLFAPGSDSSRDWASLLKAVGGDPRFELVLMTRHAAAQRLAARWSNVRLLPWAGLPSLLSAYDACDLVVIPMRPNNYSGITVALEAAWRQRPVLAARTGGVEDYLGAQGAAWYAPGDVAGLRQALLDCRPDTLEQLQQTARKAVAARDCSTQGMLMRYLALGQWRNTPGLGGSQPPDANPGAPCHQGF